MKTETIAKLRQLFSCNPQAVMPFWVTSLFFAATLLYPILIIAFELKPQVTDFSSHIISNAALSGLDISKRINLFYKLMLGFPLLTFLFFAVINKFAKKGVNASQPLLKTLTAVSTIGIACIVTGILLVNIDFCIVILLLLSLFVVIELRANRFGQDVALSLWPVFVSIIPAILFYTYFKKNNFFEITPPEFFTVLPSDFNTALFALFVLIGAAVLYFLPFAFLKTGTVDFYNKRQAFLLASLPLMGAPAIISAALEFINILNIRIGFTFSNPIYLFTAITIITAITGFFVYRKYSNKVIIADVFEKYFLPVALFSFAMLITQPWKMMNPMDEFYETANHGLAVDHFFRYGSIPIVENFDAHMLSGQIMCYVYGFLNGYEPWAVFLYQSYLTILHIFVVFFVLKKPLGTLNSFLIVLFLPGIELLLNEYGIAGMLMACVFWLLKEQSLKNYYKFWAVAVFLCFYKLDIGFAATISAIITFTILNYCSTGKVQLKRFVITGAICAGSLLALFALLCLIKGINPVLRLQEFLWAAMSNQSWAVVRMGNMSHFLFRLSYNILPLLGMICLFIIISRLVYNARYREYVYKTPQVWAAFGLFLYFLFFFVLNVPRGIVRHSFEYGNIIRILSTLPVALLMVTLLLNKWRLPVFLAAFFGFYLVLNANNPEFKNRNYALINGSFNSTSFHEQFSVTEKFPGTRMRGSIGQAAAFKSFLDAVLDKNETYYDFSSYNYYHALTGRKNPSYVNQTPLLLNGDKAQDLEIERLKELQLPIVLMPIKGNAWHAVDEVYVDFKYYKMSEYIYANYTPLQRMATFDVYVLKSRKAQILQKLKAQGMALGASNAGDLSFLMEDKVFKNNLTLKENSDNHIIATPTGPTPFIIGVMQSLREMPGFSQPAGQPAELIINLQATATGNFKIYYNMAPTDAYSEERVKQFSINPGDNTILLNLPAMPHELMVGINTAEVTFTGIALKNSTGSSVNKPEKIDYMLGEVPRLWAEESGEEVFAILKATGEPAIKNAASVNKPAMVKAGQGYYAVADITSKNDIACHVDIVENNEVKGVYNFAVKKGRHKYAVRVSSNYYWANSGKNTKINFAAPEPVEIHNFTLVSEDGKQKAGFDKDLFTLSNMTDENWSGGVGLKYNMLLLDYSPQTEKLLRANKKLKFKDNTTVTIKNFSTAGNYINLEIEESLEPFKDVAAYPNAVKIIK